MLTSDFDYLLPLELIAQVPTPERDHSRLLVLHRQERRLEHRLFPDLLAFLRPDDVLVLNNSRVIPARLRGRHSQTGGAFEVLLFEENQTNDWWALLRPGRRARLQTRIVFHNPAGLATQVSAVLVEKTGQGHHRLHFSGTPDIRKHLAALGEMPLPPYIKRTAPNLEPADATRYQTVFACDDGSVAAPTAGLHFTAPLLARIRRQGVRVCFITLHVGLGTFAPVKSSQVAEHAMHAEHYSVSPETADLINAAREQSRRVIAVGTTTLRTLESAVAGAAARVVPGPGRTSLFLYPPASFRIVDALLTNFHLPRSTLLMLVSAFAAPGQTTGRELILGAYAEAIRRSYRFYSYGDAMLLL